MFCILIIMRISSFYVWEKCSKCLAFITKNIYKIQGFCSGRIISIKHCFYFIIKIMMVSIMINPGHVTVTGAAMKFDECHVFF